LLFIGEVMESPLFTPPASPQNTASDEELATLDVPPIPGLYYFTDFFSSEEAEHIVEEVIEQCYFDVDNGRDQAVLFGSRGADRDAGLPQWTRSFLSLVASHLKGKDLLPAEVYDLLFSPQSTRNSNTYTRQLILNCYQPGQGISSHIDLPHKFLDGIMIFSFGSAIAMTFESVKSRSAKHSVYLLPGSLCVLSGESRWHWKHGIPGRRGDYVAKRHIKRGQRLSITVRWYRLEDGGGEELNCDIGNEEESEEGTGRQGGNNSDARLAASCNG
jgi:alkylated DNA repair dioxygenase AlkB